MSFAQMIKFSELTKLLEAVSTSKSIKKRDEFMQEYFKKLHKFRDEFRKTNPNEDSSLLPVIRLMMSQEERERAYGIQEKSLKQLYIKALKLNSSSSDAVKLLQCSEEDLPNKIAEIMKSRSSEGSLSVFEVDSALSYFSDNQRMALQENELCRIILGSTAIDQKWFAKMILKRMDLKVGTMKILKFYHPKAHELFLKFNHLTRVVQLIESGQAENSLIEVTKVFEPIRSMLCQKFSSNSNKSFLEKEIYQETKMDGERFQLHMKDGEFRYFSRNGHDFSAGFNTLLTPLIKFSSVVHSIILDGEMLVYDKNQRRYHTKGETTIDVKHMKDVASNLRPCFCAFDILFFNDQNFMNRQYNERNQLLSQIFDDREGVLVKTAPIKIRNIDHMVDLFNKAMENEEEGIVLKDAESIYKPGERTGGWFKVKPDYFDGAMVKEFDCIIIGGYFANPHKKNYLQRYMLGVVEKQADNDAFNVYAVGEVVHGVSVQERMKINDNLKPHMVDHCGEKEVSFGFGKIFFGKNKPDVWVPPNKSIVLECKASELAKNWEQFTEYTFRFPRISNVRRDKIWEECCTLKEFQDMCASDDGKVKKVAIRNANRDDLTSPTRKRKALASKASVIAQFCNKDDEFEDVKVLDNVLDGKEFCVMTTNPKLPSIKEMKMMIKTHGGSLTQFPRKGKTFAIIAGEMTKMVQSFMNEKIFNVIKAHWLVQNFPNEALTEMPRIRPVIDLVFATDTLKESLKQIFDEFGDSFTDAIQSEDQLKALMSTMKNISTPSVCDFTELDMELSSFGTKNLNIFRDVTAAFEQSGNENFLFNSAKSIFKFRAGEIVKLHDMRQASLLIVDKSVNELKIEYLDYNAIDFHWILDSSDAGKLLDKKKYFVDI